MKRNEYTNKGGREIGKPLPSIVAYVNYLRAKGFKIWNFEELVKLRKRKTEYKIWVDEPEAPCDVQEIDPNHKVTYNEKYHGR